MSPRISSTLRSSISSARSVARCAPDESLPSFRRHEEQLLRVAGQAPESGLRLLAQDRARLLVHFGEELLKIRGPGLLDDVPRRGRGRRGRSDGLLVRASRRGSSEREKREKDETGGGRAASNPPGEKQDGEEREGGSAAREPAQMRESVQRGLQEDGGGEGEGRVPPLQAAKTPSRRARSRESRQPPSARSSRPSRGRPPGPSRAAHGRRRPTP